MDYRQAEQQCTEIFGLPAMAAMHPRERQSMVAGMAASSEYAKLTPDQKQRAAVILGYGSAENLDGRIGQLLDKAADAGPYWSARPFSDIATRIQNSVLNATYPNLHR